MASVAPFPFASLEIVSRDEALAARRLRRAAEPFVRPEAIAHALSDLVAEKVEVIVRRVRRFDPKRCVPESIAIAVAPPETSGMAEAALVEIEAPLAAAILARALKHKPARIIDASRAPSPEIVGAVAAVVLATLRRAHAGAAARVVAAGPAHALGADLASVHRAATTAWLTIIEARERSAMCASSMGFIQAICGGLVTPAFFMVSFRSALSRNAATFARSSAGR